MAKSVIVAERKLKANLALVDLPTRTSYRKGEVCRILGISSSTFWRLLKACERDEEGRLRRPYCLDSTVLRTQRRVSYVELVDFLRRNEGAFREIKPL